MNYRASLCMTENGSTAPSDPNEQINEEEQKLVPNGDGIVAEPSENKSIIDRLICKSCFKQCNNIHKPDCNFLKSLSNKLGCVNRNCFSGLVTSIVLLGLLWILTFTLDKERALPGGSVFVFLLVYVTASVGGWLVKFVKLPSFIGRWYFSKLKFWEG